MNGLVVFANDLRIKDHAALAQAAKECATTHACFIFYEPTFKKYGGKRNQFLLDTLEILEKNLAHLGIPFHIVHASKLSDAETAFNKLIKKEHIDELFFHEPIDSDDHALITKLAKSHKHHSFVDQTLFSPGQVLNGSHEPFKVFTPFCRKFSTLLWQNKSILTPIQVPHKKTSREPQTIKKPSWLVCEPYCTDTFPAGEKAALLRLKEFLSHEVSDYAKHRDYFGTKHTSLLSPYFCIGTLSIRTALYELTTLHHRLVQTAKSGANIFFTELVWREFYRHLWAFFPDLKKGEPFRLESKNILWRHSKDDLEAWQTGNTGIPIIDAAMRAFNQTGFMHNRLRMVVASFLTKNLLIHWHEGERYFLNHLIDADMPSNNGGWQWSASTGVDPQPYFRVFNPISQSEQYDADGDFIRAVIPELKSLDNKTIHAPFTKLSTLELKKLGYLSPICDVSASRAHAIEAFAKAFKKV